MELKIKELPSVEKALNFDLEEYATMLWSTKYGLWKWDILNSKIYFSDRCFEMLGYSENNIYPYISHLIYKDDIKDFSDSLCYHIKNKIDIFHFEVRLVKIDGSYIWSYIEGKILYDKCGKALKMLGSISNITHRKKWKDNLYKIAFYDTLTKLPNLNKLKSDLEKLCRSSNSFSVITLNIDNFRTINNTLGHDIGDKYLEKISMLLQTFCSNNCSVYRHSGDEFVFILKNKDASQVVESFANLVQKTLSNNTFYIKGNELNITTTIGISIFPDHTSVPSELLRFSSSAMYYAKNFAKSTYIIYNDTISLIALKKSKLENNLRVALNNNEFEVYYQPQVNIKNGKLIGMEALLRWIKPDGSTIMPSDFIPIAEDTGLIISLGEFVLKEACSQTKLWHTKYSIPLKISVNISEKQLENKNFVYIVSDILKETKLDPKYLELEITESSAIKDFNNIVALLNKLKDINVKIALDDFGTGYSSLSYLKELPLNTIKIDKSFIDNIECDQKKKAIIKSVIILSHDIDLNIICEGVETEDQLKFLKSINCDEVQGFYFGKPLYAEEFECRFLK
ncbi:GGDEF and EAL domain-containing protein [Clostridiaceae bacterium UIB06]|uniref:GGDEF and EAL domain-containing protein n=1 Tax=Clostridium thailandense TaxID=2794346 RepID=A0A949TVI8_9CLOT|nr:GGDEF and EAL domain-containing protein [Clostridium thailandense]MBV7272230.1 GGDEF and EAL domain-containing protein [Clostridium thailandense]MCH5136485.1 GGDEF and EAL domain-containing protein [Clostridiaceae bacterium UIB06]